MPNMAELLQSNPRGWGAVGPALQGSPYEIANMPIGQDGETEPRMLYPEPDRGVMDSIAGIPGRLSRGGSPSDYLIGLAAFLAAGMGNEIPAAVTAARGLPSTVGPSIGRVLRTMRQATPGGRQHNALVDDVMGMAGQQDELTQLGGPRMMGTVTDEVARGPDALRLPVRSVLDYQRQKTANMAQQLMHADETSRQAATTALPPPKPGQPARYVDPEAQVVPGARENAMRDRLRAEDMNRGGPQARSQLAGDQEIDDFIGHVMGRTGADSNPTVLAKAAEFYAKEHGVPLSDVVAAMARRGHRIESVPTHSWQGHDARGRWRKLEPSARRFIDEVRARRNSARKE